MNELRDQLQQVEAIVKAEAHRRAAAYSQDGVAIEEWDGLLRSFEHEVRRDLDALRWLTRILPEVMTSQPQVSASGDVGRRGSKG